MKKKKGIVLMGEMIAYCRVAWVSGLNKIIFDSIY